MWVRGLKHKVLNIRLIEHRVAPHVGAWIETDMYLPRVVVYKVAPHVGAWIETARR